LRQYRSIDDQAWLWRLCSLAYKKAGLKWAARSTLVCAINTVFNDFLHEGKLSVRGVALAYDLMWRDIELGNIPAALQWLDLWGTLHRALKLQDGPDPMEGMPVQAAFALAALRSNDAELTNLAALPEIFRAFSLPFPTDAALTALGYEADVAAIAKTTEEDVLRTAALLLKQPLAMSLDRRVEWRLGETIALQSEILGAMGTDMPMSDVLHSHSRNELTICTTGPQLLLGYTKIESTVRYLGIEVGDALEMAEQTDI
jgi:hypothetical protein